jgi:hypothetical protein
MAGWMAKGRCLDWLVAGLEAVSQQVTDRLLRQTS